MLLELGICITCRSRELRASRQLCLSNARQKILRPCVSATSPSFTLSEKSVNSEINIMHLIKGESYQLCKIDYLCHCLGRVFKPSLEKGKSLTTLYCMNVLECSGVDSYDDGS